MSWYLQYILYQNNQTQIAEAIISPLASVWELFTQLVRQDRGQRSCICLFSSSKEVQFPVENRKQDLRISAKFTQLNNQFFSQCLQEWQ